MKSKISPAMKDTVLRISDKKSVRWVSMEVWGDLVSQNLVSGDPDLPGLTPSGVELSKSLDVIRQETRKKRNLSSEVRSRVMRDLGLKRTINGSWE